VRFHKEIGTLNDRGSDDETAVVADELEVFTDEFEQQVDRMRKKEKLTSRDVRETIRDRLYMVSRAVGSQAKDAVTIIKRTTANALGEQLTEVSVESWMELLPANDNHSSSHGQRIEQRPKRRT